MADWRIYHNRWALVTGAGDSIGRMLVLWLGHAGMRDIVQDIRENAAQCVVEEINQPSPSSEVRVTAREEETSNNTIAKERAMARPAILALSDRIMLLSPTISWQPTI